MLLLSRFVNENRVDGAVCNTQQGYSPRSRRRGRIILLGTQPGVGACAWQSAHQRRANFRGAFSAGDVITPHGYEIIDTSSEVGAMCGRKIILRFVQLGCPKFVL